MEEKILALLKSKFSGEREDGLSLLASAIALQADTEEIATQLVDGLTLEKVKSYVNKWRKNTDAELTKSNKTLEENLKKKFDFVEKAPTSPPEGGDVTSRKGEGEQGDALVKALEKMLLPLQQKLEAMEKGKTSESRMKVLTEALKEANPAFKQQTLKSFQKMTFDSDDDFTAYVEEMKNDSENFMQELHNQGLSNNGAPYVPNRQNNKTATEKECDTIVENLNI